MGQVATWLVCNRWDWQTNLTIRLSCAYLLVKRAVVSISALALCVSPVTGASIRESIIIWQASVLA